MEKRCIECFKITELEENSMQRRRAREVVEKSNDYQSEIRIRLDDLVLELLEKAGFAYNRNSRSTTASKYSLHTLGSDIPEDSVFYKPVEEASSKGITVIVEVAFEIKSAPDRYGDYTLFRAELVHSNIIAIDPEGNDDWDTMNALNYTLGLLESEIDEAVEKDLKVLYSPEEIERFADALNWHFTEDGHRCPIGEDEHTLSLINKGA